MAEVRLENVNKIYKGNVHAVQNLNLTIKNGEFVALLGPSGCGKTSTLRMIVGLEDITSGSIFIGDRRVNDLEPNQRNVALAFETYALYPPLSVRENIAFCLRARNMPANEVKQRVEEVARILDITDILERKPAELGGGQKQRISLARALVRQPAVFLLDEPLSHLDAAQRAHMRTELKRLHADVGGTMVLVTHDQLEAIAMAERIVVMNLGVLQQVGTFDEIYNHPVNEFVAGFIGEPPMNFLPCTPQSEAGKMFLQAKDNGFRLALTDELRARVAKGNPTEIHLGIRPIHITVRSASAGAANDLAIAGQVYTYEDLGEEGQLAAHVGEQMVLVNTAPGLDFVRGDNVSLHFLANRMHLFDAKSELAL